MRARRTAISGRRARTRRATRSAWWARKSWLGAHCHKRVALAVDPPSDFEVILCQHDLAIYTSEASRMEFLVRGRSSAVAGRRSSLEILPFDTAMAARTERTIRFVVMVLAVGLVVDDIKVSGSKWLCAGTASEALFVPATRQSAVGGFHRFALDGLVASTTHRPDAWGCWATNSRRFGVGVRRWWWESWRRSPVLGWEGSGYG